MRCLCECRKCSSWLACWSSWPSRMRSVAGHCAVHWWSVRLAAVCRGRAFFSTCAKPVFWTCPPAKQMQNAGTPKSCSGYLPLITREKDDVLEMAHPAWVLGRTAAVQSALGSGNRLDMGVDANPVFPYGYL